MCTSRLATAHIREFLKYQTGIGAHYRILKSHTYNIFFRLLFNDQFTTKTTGGFVVYYVSSGKGKVTAFKPVSSIKTHYSYLLTRNLGLPHACR